MATQLQRLLVSCTLLLTAAVATATDFGLPGPYSAGQRSVTVTRASGSTFTAQVHYPATAAGANQPFHPQAGPAPAVTFGHGFLQPTSRYASTLQHLATHGFIVIASESEGSLFPSHGNFASDISRCLTFLEQQNATAGSFLAGKVDTAAFGISGHSMGGGASLLAAAADGRIRALAVEAPADTNPSAIAASSSVAAPSLLIVGDADTIVPTASHGQPMYNALRSPRQLANIRGGSHCGFIDANGLGCDAASLPRNDQLVATRRLLTSWFSLYLKDDASLWRSTWGPSAPIDARVALTADARMTISPRTIDDTLRPGATHRIELVIGNSDEAPMDADVSVEDAAGTPAPWNASVVPAAIRGLAPGTSVTVSIDVVAPDEGAVTLFITARSINDGGTVTWASIELTVACPADFNLDGGIDGADVGAFFLAWTAGGADADINTDGGIDGGDVETFFLLWEAGGC
ncbi:MAG: hypothetical protein RL689_1247 [Planctomycetota bacterium]